jgi:hypothetical protein
MGAVVFVGGCVGGKHDRAHEDKRLLGLVYAFLSSPDDLAGAGAGICRHFLLRGLQYAVGGLGCVSATRYCKLG